MVTKKNDGTTEDFKANHSEIAPVNNFFQSLFQSVTCSINGVELTDPNGNWYPYKSYIETILSYSKNTKQGRLKSSCWYGDDAGEFDSIGSVDGSGQTATQSTNSGYLARKIFFNNSTTRYFNIPLHSDITTLRKYLPPNVKLEFEFHRSPDHFSLLSPYDKEKCLIVIEDLELSVIRYTPSPALQNHHMSQLTKKRRQVLPIDRSLIKTYT